MRFGPCGRVIGRMDRIVSRGDRRGEMRADLDAWAKARLGKIVHSTSELVNRGA